MKIEVKLDISELSAALGGLVDAMAETTPLTKNLAQVMAEASDRAFAAESDPITGAKWPKLNPDYKSQRHAQGHTGPMLQRGGTLISSRHQEYGHLYARYGTNMSYAAIHCFGGITRAHWIRPRDKKALMWRKGGKTYIRRAVMHPGSEIPRRRFIGVGPQDKADMQDIIAEYVRKALQGR